ncbi:MAG TPA: heme-binding protein [Fimbriiglobus sp.]
MSMRRRTWVELHRLEPRNLPSVTAALAAGVLSVTGDAANNWIDIYLDGTDLVVSNKGETVGRFDSASVTSVTVNGNGGNDVLRVEPDVTQPATLTGGSDPSKLKAGGGNATLQGGADRDVLVGGAAQDSFDGGAGENLIERLQPTDPYVANPADRVARDALLPNPDLPGAPQQVILTSDPQGVNEVEALLSRAAAASASNDGIFAVVDRNGRILGVRVESGVDPAITGDPAKLAFAIDGAVAEARTGAFFASNQAPLTSRTVGFISQTPITQREVDSNPNIPDPNSTDRGPGFVANVNIAGHFPPGIALTPQVDLFGIEYTNRDGSYATGPDGIIGTPDDVLLDQRFDIDPTYVPPGQSLFPPDSYGSESGVSPRTANGIPIAQSRGIGTLPGGIPIYKFGQVVGGIGVFFPGKTGYATEENSSNSSTFDPTKPDRTLEAEFIALAAVGGVNGVLPVGTLGGVALPAGFGIPLTDPGRIDLVGIQLDVFGPGGREEGVDFIRREVETNLFGAGNPNDGTDQVVDADANNDGVANDPVTLRDGVRSPDGWLVVPHDGVGISATEVTQIINNAINQANQTRAAIRLGIGERAKMVFAVTDKTGEVLGLYRMPDATIFSIDVAVAKARNVAYFADPTKLNPLDQVFGIPAGVAFTNRTFRYLSEPRFPEGIDGAPPGPFSQLNDDPGTDPFTGLQVGPRLPASAYQSVLGRDAFNPGTNFHDPNPSTRQNGIVFFPGSAPLYRGANLIGGLGVSGDGVDQDDVVTGAAGQFFQPPTYLMVDQFTFNGVRLPYQKNNRNPEG